MNILIPYDISDDKRRRQVDKLLSSFGSRVNYSVFELELTQSKLYQLIKVLEKLTDPKLDHLRIYVLNKESMKKSFVLHQEGGVFKHEILYL